MEKDRKFIFYKIVSYILVFVAGFFGMMLLMVLPAALTNPAMLFGVFVIAGVVLYSFTSFRFMKQGLVRNQTFRKRFKDLIKVNGYVSLFFVIQTFFVFGGLLMQQDLLRQSVEDLFRNPPAGLSDFSKAEQEQLKFRMIQALQVAGWCIFIYAVLLVLHLIATFNYLKQKNNLFISEDAPRQ